MPTPDQRMAVLLDQNVPADAAVWLRKERPDWDIRHVNEIGLEGKPDDFLYTWAQEHGSALITYDEDFADARFYPLGAHFGIIRLRIWPTTIEETIKALSRLLAAVSSSEWRSSLIIVDNHKIRIRKMTPKGRQTSPTQEPISQLPPP